MDLSTDFLIIFSIVIFISSLIHGSIGFGFPLIATPLLAIVTDMKTAILYIAIPTLLINLISIYSEENFFQAIKRFYPLAITAMIGSAIGTLILFILIQSFLSSYLHFQFFISFYSKI